MRTHIHERPLDDRTDEEQRLVAKEGAPPWQLPQISPESAPIGLTHARSRATVIETNYVVDWQLKPARS